jgi:phage anti-repressor protein
MRDILSKLDALINETALNPNDMKGDYDAKKKALQDIQVDPSTSKDPELKAELARRKADLEKEARDKGVIESTFEIGDAFDISFTEDSVIESTIVDILEDGIVIELDDAALEMLTNEGLTFLEGEVVNEEKQKGVDGKACWKGYKRMGTKQKGGKTVDNCVKMGEDLDESGLQYYTGKKKYGKDGMSALAQAGRGGANQEELGKIKDKYAKEDHGPEDPDAEYNQGEYDREGDMAKDQIRTINSAAKELYAIIDANENLPEWVQKKIILAMDYIDTARDYMKANKYVEDAEVSEAEYQGRKVSLGKPMAGDVKKSKVYVKNPQGRVVKVNFGDKKMKIKKSNPARRKSFRARHNCANPGPRHKARYWSCRAW